MCPRDPTCRPTSAKGGVEFLDRYRKERFFLHFSTYLPHDQIKNGDGSTLTAPEAVVRKYE
jgi:hypothetical protein